jgi:hypothetical protein
MSTIDYWMKRRLFGYCETFWLGRLRICGNSEFRERTIQALGLLEEAGQSEFVATTLTEICQGLRSTGYILPRGTLTYVVGEFTWKLTPPGYASMIAHHAFRKEAYENTVGSVVARTEADCLLFQETILEKLLATDEEWDDATGLAMNEAMDVFLQESGKERQKQAEDCARRYGLYSMLPNSWFYSVADHKGIRIQGSEEFIALSCRALELLAKFPEWNIVVDNIRSIKQSSKSSTYIRTGGKRKGVVTVGWPDWRAASSETYAGAIAHETYHNQISREPETTIDDPTGREEERRCIDFQIRVLEKLGNADNEIRHLRIQRRFPTHFGSKENLFDLIWNIRGSKD